MSDRPVPPSDRAPALVLVFASFCLVLSLGIVFLARDRGRDLERRRGRARERLSANLRADVETARDVLRAARVGRATEPARAWTEIRSARGRLASWLEEGPGTASSDRPDRDWVRRTVRESELPEVLVDLLVLEGELARELDAPSAALEAFEGALALDPVDPRALAGRALCRAGQDRAEPALRELDRVLALDPLRSDLWLARGRLLEDLGRREDALEAYRDARRAERRPGDLVDRRRLRTSRERALEAEVALLVERGEADGAREAARDFLARHPSSYEARLQEGRLLELLGRREEAADAYRVATGREPAALEAELALVRLALAGGRLGAAARRVDRLRARVGDRPPARLAAALVAAHRPDDGRLEELLDGAPSPSGLDAPGAAWLLGRVERLRGRPRAARRAFDRALSLAPDHRPSLLDRAAVALATGDREGAREDLSRADRIGPGSPEVLAGLARLGLAEGTDGGLRRAASALAEAVREAPEVASHWADRAAVADARDAPAAARRFGRRALELEEALAARSGPAPDPAAAFLRRAVELRPVAGTGTVPGEGEEAASWRRVRTLCDRTLRLAPRLARAHLLRAEALEHLGAEDEALEALRAAARANPVCVEARRLLGERALARDDAQAALRWFGEAVEGDGGDLEARLGRARARRRTGFRAGAIADLERVLEAEDAPVEAAELLVELRESAGERIEAAEARRLLRRVRARTRGAARERFLEGLDHLRRREWARALEDLDQAVAADPGLEAEARTVRGRVLLALRRPEEGVLEMVRGLSADPTPVHELHLDLVTALHRADRSALEEAASSLESPFPALVRGLHRMYGARAYPPGRERAEEALALLTEVLEAAPEHHLARHQRARLLRALDRADEAAADLERILEDRPALVPALLELARVRCVQIRPDRALDLVLRAAEAGFEDVERLEEDESLALLRRSPGAWEEIRAACAPGEPQPATPATSPEEARQTFDELIERAREETRDEVEPHRLYPDPEENGTRRDR